MPFFGEYRLGTLISALSLISALKPKVRKIPALYCTEPLPNGLNPFNGRLWRYLEGLDRLDFQEQISEYLVDVLIDSGYLILVYVYTPEQQIAKARRELTRTEQRQIQLGQFLGQAAALGLA